MISDTDTVKERMEHTLRDLGHGISNEESRSQPGEVIALHSKIVLHAHDISVLSPSASASVQIFR